MDHFAGLDVSVKETSVCIVDGTGRIVKEVKAASEPQALLKVLGNPAYRFKRRMRAVQLRASDSDIASSLSLPISGNTAAPSRNCGGRRKGGGAHQHRVTVGIGFCGHLGSEVGTGTRLVLYHHLLAPDPRQPRQHQSPKTNLGLERAVTEQCRQGTHERHSHPFGDGQKCALRPRHGRYCCSVRAERADGDIYN
jgi:hypothetical protein